MSGRAEAAGREAAPDRGAAGEARLSLLTVEIRYEKDVVLARQRARQVAALLGFDAQDQTRIATAVSELARNAFEYAGGGRVRYELDGSPSRQALVVRVSDAGPGIADVAAVLDGRYVSPTGMGVGLVGARRLADRFHIESAPGRGTVVEIARLLPRAAPRLDPATVARLGEALAREAAQDPFEEVRQQNQELLRTLHELRARQVDIERLNAELAETNRGVLALYAELDDRAEDLRRASEYKSRFLSDISHEFRTPLTSVLNMTRFLLDRADGDLTSEQERQVTIIRNSVSSLIGLVNDMLDFAKIEAGQTVLRPSEFAVGDLLAGLRGMFRPLVLDDAVALVFDDAHDALRLHTDEQRLSQVLRNLVSNAVKFTERGEIRVSVAPEPGDLVRFVVRDTGIGIAPEHHARIFEDYAQVEGPIQHRVRGTGLGLPLARKLAALLGGRVELESALGVGSTFTLVVPRRLAEATDDA